MLLSLFDKRPISIPSRPKTLLYSLTLSLGRVAQWTVTPTGDHLPISPYLLPITAHPVKGEVGLWSLLEVKGLLTLQLLNICLWYLNKMVVIVERSFPSHPEQCLTYWNLLFQAFEEPSHDSLEKIHSHVKRRAKTRDEKEGAEKTCPVLATRLPGNNGGVSLSKLGTTNTWPCDVIWKESFSEWWRQVGISSRDVKVVQFLYFGDI